MDAQLKRGLFEAAVLRTLKKGDSYGYMIIKRISERSDNTFNFKEGTLYPILHNFEANGYVKSYTVPTEGRVRKYYKITEKGLKTLREAKEEWTAYTDAVKKVIDVKSAAASL